MKKRLAKLLTITCVTLMLSGMMTGCREKNAPSSEPSEATEATENTENIIKEETTEEIISEEEKIGIIKNHLTKNDEKEETITSKPHQNNLIFVPTTGGNIRVLDELDKISPEYYARFFELFQSIKDGTFKNEQRFS